MVKLLTSSLRERLQKVTDLKPKLNNQMRCLTAHSMLKRDMELLDSFTDLRDE